VEIIFLVVSTIVIIELVHRSTIASTSKNLQNISQKTVSTVQSNKISDHWKQKAILAYACKIFLTSTKLLANLLFIFSPVILLLLIDTTMGTSFMRSFTSWLGIGLCSGVAIAYWQIRKRFG